MAKRRSRGDGAVYYDENRKMYIGQVNLGHSENGKRKRKTVYGKSKAEVMEKLKNIEYQIFTGSFVDANQITIYHLAKQILDDKLNQNEIKEATYYRNGETLKQLAAIYNTPLQDAHETQIRAFLNNNLHYSQSVIKKIYSLLNSTFKEALRRKIITENPMEFIKPPRSKQQEVPVRALTKEEQRKFLAVLQTEDINYKNQMLLSLSLGLRMGEVNALHVEDINFNFNRLTIKRTVSKDTNGNAIISGTTKTKAGERILTMTDTVRQLLKESIADKTSGLIFTHKNKIITTTQVNAQFARIMKKYNIIDETISDGKIDLHSLRHTFGTRCAEAGMPPKVLQEIMGHTDITITMNTYFYATSDYIKDNLYKIDNILKDEGLSLYPAKEKAI